MLLKSSPEYSQARVRFHLALAETKVQIMCLSKFPHLVSTFIYGLFSGVMAAEITNALSVPLLEDSKKPTINAAKKTKELPWNIILITAYSLFLCWQLIGMCLYIVRAVTCFKHNVPTFMCDVNVAFPYSATVELFWLITRCLQIIITIAVLPKLADFLGFKAILRQLKSLPQFWSLLFLLLVALSRYAVLFVFSDPKAPFYFPFLVFFALSNILRVLAVIILNFTRLNSVKHQSTKAACVFSKMSFVVMYIDNLLRFVISLLAFSMEVNDLNHQEQMKYSCDFLLIYHILQKFGTSFFHYKIMDFFWQKLFADDKDVLSNHYTSHSLEAG